MKIFAFLVRRFVPGSTMEKAIAAVRKLNDKKIMTTLDILGEDVKNKTQAEKAADDYIAVLEEINKSGVSSHVSLKLTMMGLRINEDFCLKNVERVIKRANELNNFVRIDIEGSDVTQITFDIFKNLHKKYPKNVGLVFQAYLFRTEKDVEETNRLKARVRICKGAYKEPATIAYKKMNEIRDNFMKLTKMLLNDGVYPAIATHDKILINRTIEYTKENKIPKDKYEFQMLYGLQRALQEKLAEDGYNVRCYVPFGAHWFPYYYRRLRERKENVFFILKTFFKK